MIKYFRDTFTCSEYVDYPGLIYIVPFVEGKIWIFSLPFLIFDLVHVQFIWSFRYWWPAVLPNSFYPVTEKLMKRTAVCYPTAHYYPLPAPVAGACSTAIGGRGQSWCMRPVCHRYSSELQISVCTMLKDAATLSWVGLVKQVLPSRDSCWLASANGAVASSSLARAEWRYRLLSCPGSAAAAEQLGATLAAEQL